MFMWLLKIKRCYWRWRMKNNSASELLLSCWSQESLSYGQLGRETDFLVVDTETSSLDPSTGELLSIGWVVIRQGRILMDSAEHYLLKSQRSVGVSATIHQIRDCELDDGLTHSEIMKRLLYVAKNKVLVFHHAPLDMAFLNRSSRAVYGMPLLWPALDTLQIEKHILEKKQIPLGKSVLRLASCRARYNLPSYPAHNALVDALATAELLLAQIEYRGERIRLADLA
jgi:DNA polymerase-3 subunit epsilon